MRWIAVALGAALAASGLAWGLVTTGHWPLDDREQPAAAVYALNRALGRWLADHGEPLPAECSPADPPPAGGSGGPGAPAGRPRPPPGLTPAEKAAVQEALRSDPRLRDRGFFRPGLPAACGTPRRG